MNVNKVMSVFRAKFPKLTITRVIDYDREHFVVEALEDLSKLNYNNPYYGVDKKSSKITGFIPSFDMDAFIDAVENRTVYSLNGGE